MFSHNACPNLLIIAQNDLTFEEQLYFETIYKNGENKQQT